MYRKFYALSILLSLFFVSATVAQEMIWMTTDGLSYMKLDGSGLTQASDLAPHSVLGKSTAYYVNAGLYLRGINTEGGEENQTTGAVSPGKKGTVFELSGHGLIQLHQFREGTDDPANTTLFVGADENLYYMGPYYTSTGNKQYQIGKVGSTGTRILQYAFNPNELFGSHEYYMTYPGTYGTSQTGGNNNAGFLFKVNSTNTGIEIKYHFKKETGSMPVGMLARSTDENYLYGVTKTGGMYNYGVVFKVQPNGTNYQVLHHFNKTDGAYPDRGLCADYNGFLYGVTSKGGLYNKGVIYAAYYEGGIQILHHFNTEGAPEATYKVEQSLLMAYDNMLIGKNNSSIYSISPSSPFRILRNIATRAIAIRSSAYPGLQLKYPAHAATNVPVSTTFKADTLDGALHYTLQLSTSEYFQSIAQTVQSTTPNFQVQGLKPGTKYYARYKTSFWPDYGHSSSFTTAIASTSEQSVVTTPADGATNVEAPTLKVTVRAVTGATRYTVEVSASSSFATVKSVSSSVDDQRTLTLTNLSYNTTYYARVKTNINSVYGAVTTFKTKPQVFSKVTNPVNGTPNVEFAVAKITAQPIANAKRYTLEVNSNSTFTGNKIVYTSLSDGQNSFVIRDLSPATTYYTRVKADVNTTWGSTQSFSTRERKPLTRIWGITAGSEYAGGSIFSFSVDSMKFTKHHQAAPEFGFGKDMILGPDGFYGPSLTSPYQLDPHASVFRYEPTADELVESGVVALGELRTFGEVRMTMASNQSVYAVSNTWENAGKITRITPGFTSIKDFYFFKTATGRDPFAKVIEVDGWFYGTTNNGGSSDFGSLYRVRPDGSNYQMLHSFHYNDAFFPRGLAYGNDGWIYGISTDGPLDNGGAIYRIKPDGSIYELLHIFTVNGPYYPEGDIMVKDGVIYGVTSFGGTQSAGAVFRMDTDGTDFVILVEFNGTNGYGPNGGLVMDHQGYLYGTTMSGGTHHRGTLFRVRKDGAVFQKLFDFSDATGPNPLGNVIVTDDNFAPQASPSATLTTARVDVYPNPTTEAFRITPADIGSAKMYVELSDFNGMVVFKSGVEPEGLEIGNALPKGIYVLKVINGDQVTTHRLVKK
jgi:uncharacterized repeat protein (TIGR03803 family)